MIKRLFLVFFVLLFIPIVSGQPIQLYGGDSAVVFSFNDTCVNVSVSVSSTQPIEFTSQGVREYDLLGCTHTSSDGLFSDEWFCDCNGAFDLVLSVLPNAVNTYTFTGIAYFSEENNVNSESAGPLTVLHSAPTIDDSSSDDSLVESVSSVEWIAGEPVVERASLSSPPTWFYLPVLLLLGLVVFLLASLVKK